jgi:hypothetical protein
MLRIVGGDGKPTTDDGDSGAVVLVQTAPGEFIGVGMVRGKINAKRGTLATRCIGNFEGKTINGIEIINWQLYMHMGVRIRKRRALHQRPATGSNLSSRP